MRIIVVAAPALVFAGLAVAQGDSRPDPLDPRVKVPPVEFRSAFEAYRPFVDSELRDWRKSNEEAGAAGGHAGHRTSQERDKKAPKPRPDKPDQGHGGHK